MCVFGISKLENYSGWAFSEMLAIARGGWEAKIPSIPKTCHTSYNEESWHSYTLLEEDPKKYINHVTHLLSSASISIFSLEISNIHYIRKYRYISNFNTWFLILFTFLSLVCSFDDVRKNGYSRPS